jgi:hypothetical protein
MFKVKAQNSEEKAARINKLKKMLDSLKNSVKEIQTLETGVNFSTRETAFDLILISEFKSKEDLKRYSDHPDHRQVVGYLDSIKEKVAVVDYEL